MPCPTERVGKCGEHLTASFLYSFGSDLVTMPHGSHADIVFEYKNILYKCQVKTVTKKKKYILLTFYAGLFIELKNSALFFVVFNFELIKSMASIDPIGAIILLKTFIF